MNLAVHRHTIPGFISVEKLAGVYLVGSTARVNLDGDGDSEEDSEAESEEGGPVKPGQLKTGRKQDLRGFVRELRRELMAWHLRSDAIVYLREKLGLEDGEDRQSEAENEDGWEAKEKVLRNDLGIVGLEATATEARYVRMEWEDGRLGRFKLSNTGTVERAVFMNDNGRDKQVEDAMTGGGGRVESLFDRLKGISSESAAEVTP